MEYKNIYELKLKKQFYDTVRISFQVDLKTLETIIPLLENIEDKIFLNKLKRACKRGQKYKAKRQKEYLNRVKPNFNN